MGSEYTTHTYEADTVTFERIGGESGLKVNVRRGTGTDVERFAMWTTPAVLADLLVELSTWPDVVTAAGERFRDAILNCGPVDDVPRLDPIAADYFRRGFEHYGMVLAELEGADDSDHS
jgi:hypothetical protein